MTSTPADTRALRKMALIIRRYRRLMILTWFMTMAGSAIYTFASPRLYRPQATIEIRPEAPLLGSDQEDPSTLSNSNMWRNYFRTQKSVLTGPGILEKTLRKLPEPVRQTLEEEEDPVEAFRERLDIEEERASFLLRVGFLDEDPELATQVVNTLVSVYLEETNRQLRELKSSAGESLSKEALPDIRKRVTKANQQMQEFQASTGFIDPEEHYKSILDARTKFHARLTTTRLKSTRIRAEYKALSGYATDGIRGLFHSGFHKTKYLEELGKERIRVIEEIAQQKKILKEKHPVLIQLREELATVEDKIREAVGGMMDAMQTELAAAGEEEKELSVEITKLDEQLTRAGATRNRYQQRVAELEAARELYSAYLKKHGETTATAGTGLASIRVSDHARIPTHPYRPNILLNLVLGGVMGLVLGIAAVFVANRFDSRILSPDELEAFAGLETLGIVPKLEEGKKSEGNPVFMDQDSVIAEFEAFRNLRVEVRSRMEKFSGTPTLAILSPVPGDGKTTVTANFAHALALQNQKVLIIDADMRKPQIRKVLCRSNGPGLEEFLLEKAAWDEAVHPSRIPGVDVLGMSHGTDKAGELATTPRFAATIRTAQEKYDHVLIDSPPVLSVSEASIVGRNANAVILVVRQGWTDLGAVASAKKKLTGMKIEVLGAVFNCAERQAGGYAYYNYDSYGTEGGGKT